MGVTIGDSTVSQSDVRGLPQVNVGVLRVLDGRDQGRSIAVEGAPIVVGSGESCDLRLHDRKVSRSHVSVSLGSRGFLVRDLNSRNGTYIDGVKVGEVAVAPGTVLRIGNTTIGLYASGKRESVTPSDEPRFGPLVGVSVAMRRVFTLLGRAAASDVTALVTGETGTGKNLAARAIHDHSDRKDGPFVVFDCASIMPDLLQAQLFGHIRGAFPGADDDSDGLVGAASAGTLLIDEVGELPLPLQGALLRLCEDQTFSRVGESKTRSADVRIIATSRRDLKADVAGDRFRSDLFYRLQVLHVTLPPVRSRKEDVPELVEALLADLGVADPGSIEGENLDKLIQHRWPGNVRELRNALAGAVAAPGAGRFADLRIHIDEFRDSGSLDESFQGQKKRAVGEFEHNFLRDLMATHEGNLRQAARAAGLERTQLKRLLRKHGLR